MNFGGDYVFDTSPVVTNNTVTWRWQESTSVPPEITGVIGYQMYYWHNNQRYSGPDIAYTWTVWQTGTVTGLVPGTEYQFNIAVYRTWLGQKKMSDNWAYPGKVNQPLIAITKGERKFTIFTTRYLWPIAYVAKGKVQNSNIRCLYINGTNVL